MTDLAARVAAKAKEVKKRKPDVPEYETKVEDVSANVTGDITQPKTNKDKPVAREGKRNIASYHPEAVWRQFKILAAENDKTGHELHREALNLLFRKYGKQPIA